MIKKVESAALEAMREFMLISPEEFQAQVDEDMEKFRRQLLLDRAEKAVDAAWEKNYGV